MQRIAVIGTSGSGKTTLARALADRLDLAHLELDAVYHQPGWTALPTDEFRSGPLRRARSPAAAPRRAGDPAPRVAGDRPVPRR